MHPDRIRGVRLLVQPWLLSSLQSPFPVPPCNLNTSCSNGSPVGGFIPVARRGSNIIGHCELCNILPWITKTMKCLNSSGEQERKKKSKTKMWLPDCSLHSWITQKSCKLRGDFFKITCSEYKSFDICRTSYCTYSNQPHAMEFDFRTIWNKQR